VKTLILAKILAVGEEELTFEPFRVLDLALDESDTLEKSSCALVDARELRLLSNAIA
jgi:hypothetical protein